MRNAKCEIIKAKTVIITLLLICWCSGVVAGPGRISGKPRYKDGIIVKYKEGVSGDTALRRQVETKYGLVPVVKKGITPFSCYRVADKNNLPETVSALEKESSVEFAQPDYIRYALYTPLPGGPNDTYYSTSFPPAIPVPTPAQWGFNAVKADQAFTWGLIEQSQQKEIIVAVLDTGVRATHQDLTGLTINGYNVLSPGSQPDDDNITPYYDTDYGVTVTPEGHGTHVAGIIGANTNNGMGVAGAAYSNSSWTAKVLIMPVKVLDAIGEGADSDIYLGVKWAVDNGANVMNYSLGGPGFSPALQLAVNYASERGCVNVAAAGNDGGPAYYPAGFGNVISVASCDENGLRSSFSNYGKIDVSGPGEYILSCGAINNSYYYVEGGTSFAAPFVSGLSALIMLKYNSMNQDSVKNLIEQTADDIGNAGYDNTTGWGRVNFVKALSKTYNAVSGETKTYCWPNPFSPDNDIYTNITFVMAAPEDVTIEIYDGGGDLVWKTEKAAAEMTYGYNYIKWDGKNLNNDSVGNGVYFYVLKTPKLYGKNKIAVLH